MKRREWLSRSAAFGALAALPGSKLLRASAGPLAAGAMTSPAASSLTPPKGSIPVAFLISDGAVVIDFCGPWEVFQDASIPGNDPLFRLYTVAEKKAPIRASGGLEITPDHTFETAPAPKVVVIPAQEGRSEATLEWIRKVSKATDVTMSVCTGAFLLAKTGLLSGKAATTHHSGFKAFAAEFPDVRLKRGARFVEEGNLATAGGLSSGIDLALRVVERYYGRDVAERTAYLMEYQGRGWTDPDSNAVYAQERTSTAEEPICPVCDMDVDPKIAPKSVYKGKTYYFCSKDHKEMFEQTPEEYVAQAP